MKKAIANLIIFLALAWGVSIFAGGCASYTVSTVRDGEVYDIFGRRYINPAPVFARIFLGEDRYGPWFGWKWWAFDMIVFWGSMLCVIKLVGFAQNLKDEKV